MPPEMHLLKTYTKIISQSVFMHCGSNAALCCVKGKKLWTPSCLPSVFLSWKFYALVTWDKPVWNLSHYSVSLSPSSRSQHFASWMLCLIPYHTIPKWKVVAPQQLTLALCKMMIISQWNSWVNFRQRSYIKLGFVNCHEMQAHTHTNSAAPANSKVLVTLTFPGSKGCLSTSCSHWFLALRFLSPKWIARAPLV